MVRALRPPRVVATSTPRCVPKPLRRKPCAGWSRSSLPVTSPVLFGLVSRTRREGVAEIAVAELTAVNAAGRRAGNVVSEAGGVGTPPAVDAALVLAIPRRPCSLIRSDLVDGGTSLIPTAVGGASI